MRSSIIATVLLLVGCDNAKREELTALEGRVSSLAEQAAADAKTIGELSAKAADATAAKEKAARLEDELGTLQARLETLETRVTTLETAPKPTTPTVRPGTPDPTARYRVDVADAQALGPSDAKVTLVVFSDFQCPFCGRLEGTFDELLKRYPSDLRIVFKHNPLAFHTNAMPAALAAEAAAKQGKFWEMHDKLFENSKDLTRTKFVALAKELKLDVRRFEADMDDPATKKLVEDHQKQANTLGARGTPASFVNGRFLSGAQPVENFASLIDTEAKEADKLIASGTLRSRVYETLMASAKTAP
jgi:protein-disulfide isomerase